MHTHTYLKVVRSRATLHGEVMVTQAVTTESNQSLLVHSGHMMGFCEAAGICSRSAVTWQVAQQMAKRKDLFSTRRKGTHRTSFNKQLLPKSLLLH